MIQQKRKSARTNCPNRLFFLLGYANCFRHAMVRAMKGWFRHDRLLLLIAFLAFVSLGLPDTVIGVAWPFVRDQFGLQQSALALVFAGAGSSYFLSSFLAGGLLNRLGVGNLLAVSSVLVAGGGFMYGLAPAWILFAAASLLHGLGSGAIDAGLNHYVASHFTARHMNWLHASYSLGATLGPLIMTGVIAANASWRRGYLTVGILLFSLAVLFALTRRRWNEPAQTAATKTISGSGRIGEALRHPVVWLQVALFFVYTGLEVTVGQWSFTILTESRFVAVEKAGLWVTLYWGSIGVGRVAFGFIVERLGIDRLLRWSTFSTLAGLLVFAAQPALSPLALILTGLGLAAIYPCMMTRTPQRLGTALAAHAIGFQVSAATAGAVAVPSLAGVLAQRFGPEIIAATALLMALILSLLHELLLLRSGRAVVSASPR